MSTFPPKGSAFLAAVVDHPWPVILCTALVIFSFGYKRAVAAGRDPVNIGIECFVAVDAEPSRLKEFAALGVTQFSLNTMSRGLAGSTAHIEAITVARERLDSVFV